MRLNAGEETLTAPVIIGKVTLRRTTWRRPEISYRSGPAQRKEPARARDGTARPLLVGRGRPAARRRRLPPAASANGAPATLIYVGSMGPGVNLHTADDLSASRNSRRRTPAAGHGQPGAVRPPSPARPVPALRRDSGHGPGPRTAAAAAGSARQYRPGRAGRNTRARQNGKPSRMRSGAGRMTQISRSGAAPRPGGWPAKPMPGADLRGRQMLPYPGIPNPSRTTLIR